jgi:glycosyltransferase involved in cell wall biosynthesis
MNRRFTGRVGLQQRVLPNYRVPFFDLLAGDCAGGLSVFAGQPRLQEGITGGELRVARYAAAYNVHILGGPLYLCYQRGLTAWLRDWDPEVLVLEANIRYLATPSAVRWMHARGRKVVGWGLGAPPLKGPLQALQQDLRREFLGQFDALIAYSRRGASEYAALGIAHHKIFVATNAVAPRPTEMRAGARRLENQGSILFVGRLQARKHVDFLLRACAELPEPKPELVIVGDGPERQALQALARRIYPSARFEGAKHGPELQDHFLAANLFVLPGTGGLAVQEAMANGLPVIVAKGDGTQDDLVREGNGWQVPPGDYESLVTSIRAALSDPLRLRKMGDESRRIISEEINLEGMVESFVAALSSLK